MVLELVPAARLASLASGRGGTPALEEWPFVLAVLALLAFVGTRVLVAIGLTKVEALLVAALSPLLVLVDAPLGRLSDTVSLAANLAGCLIPSAVALKVLLERRVPFAEGFFLVGVGIVVSYFSSHVVADRGVLLQYRIPALVVGVVAAALLYRQPERAGLPGPAGPFTAGGPTAAGRAGAGGFAAGALGVVFGADVFRLGELAGGSGRVILGGAGLLDGIILVAVLAAAIAELTALVLRNVVVVKRPSEPTV